MPETQNARHALLRRTLIALVGLAAIAAATALILTLTIPLRDASTPPVAPAIAIVVSPHPDDETYAMGQTIATQDIEGVYTIGVLVTDGESSSFVEWWAGEHGEDLDGDGDIDEWDFGLARRKEYTEALKVLGVDEIIFLGGSDSQGARGFRDGSVDAAELQEALAGIAAENPGATWFTVASYDSERLYRGDYKNHPDHAQVATAVKDVAADSDGGAYYFKVYVYYLLPFARLAPTRVVGSAEALERKREAVAMFGTIGATSTPELFSATSKDEAEYLVPVFDR